MPGRWRGSALKCSAGRPGTRWWSCAPGCGRRADCGRFVISTFGCARADLDVDRHPHAPSACASTGPGQLSDRRYRFTPGRIEPFVVNEGAARFPVRPSDLDLNGHVNNLSFAQWILNASPLSMHREHALSSYEVNFLAEVCEGTRW